MVEFIKKLFTKKRKKIFEIERKFLLKSFPSSWKYEMIPDHIYSIVQYYYIDESGIGKRVRVQEDETNYQGKEGEVRPCKFIVTEKKYVSKGKNEEYEHEINEDEFLELKKISVKKIQKARYVFKVDSGLKWEVDEYRNMSLITAEIEIPSLKHKIVIPDFIKDVLIEEVTGRKCFNNYALAESLNE